MEFTRRDAIKALGIAPIFPSVLISSEKEIEKIPTITLPENAGVYPVWLENRKNLEYNKPLGGGWVLRDFVSCEVHPWTPKVYTVPSCIFTPDLLKSFRWEEGYIQVGRVRFVQPIVTFPSNHHMCEGKIGVFSIKLYADGIYQVEETDDTKVVMSFHRIEPKMTIMK